MNWLLLAIACAHQRQPRAIRLPRAATCLAAILGLATAGLAPAAARADGDPASDVLATQTLFLPWDADVPASDQARLSALLAAAQRGGHPVRVALIASAADLGSVGALWHRPQAYAEFLAEELSLVYRGPLLVVMPNGFGLARLQMAPGVLRSALAGIPVPHSGAELAGDAAVAVRRLAVASGHRLAATAAVTLPPDRRGSSAMAWLAFVIGLVLIFAAWTVSLRAMPPRRRRSSPA
jgi:hypothetical protein